MISHAARHLVAGVSLSVALLAVGGASAQGASRVVLLRASGEDVLCRQATTLLTAELEAFGFEVVEIDGDARHDLRRDIEAVSSRLQPIATFALRSVPGGTAAELWLEDRVTGKLVIRRVDVTNGPRAAADLAVKSVELLRGSLLEVTVRPSHEGSNSATAVLAPRDVRNFVNDSASRSLDYFAEGVGVSAGAIAARNLALAAAYAPLLRISWGNATGYLFRATAAGLGSSPRVTAVEGEGRVDQTFMLVESLRLFRARARLQPMLGLAAGLHRVHTSGMGVSSLFPDGTGTTAALAAGVDVGIAARLGYRLAVVGDLSVLSSFPRTSIKIASREVARTGGLAMVLGASICAMF